MTFPPQDLDCPDPAGCPVFASDHVLRGLPTTHVEAGRPWYRVYDGTWGYDEPNPGFGDTRFAPFDAADGHRVPTMYLAESRHGALLETVFHDVHPDSERLVYEGDLRLMLLAHVRLPAPLNLVDLRDPVLHERGITRQAIASSPAEHYPCTRRIARLLYDRTEADAPVHGMVWHSRQADLHAASPTLVLIVFADRYPARRGDWVRFGPGSQNLFEGPGRLLVDDIATELDADIVS